MAGYLQSLIPGLVLARPHLPVHNLPCRPKTFAMTQQQATALAQKLIAFLETGNAPQELFAPDMFCGFTMPQSRLQAQGRDQAIALRRKGHPAPGRVPRWQCDVPRTLAALERMSGTLLVDVLIARLVRLYSSAASAVANDG